MHHRKSLRNRSSPSTSISTPMSMDTSTSLDSYKHCKQSPSPSSSSSVKFTRKPSRSLSPPTTTRQQNIVSNVVSTSWSVLAQPEENYDPEQNEILQEDENDDNGGPQEMKFSLTSNLLFFMGATLQTMVASWDVKNARMEAASSDPDDEEEEDDDNGLGTTDYTYFVLNSLGPVCYILNAYVDAKWASTLSNNHPMASKGLAGIIQQKFIHNNYQNQLELDNAFPEEDEEEDNQEGTEEIKEKLWELTVAILFGLGAVLEFISTLLDWGNTNDMGSKAASKMNVVSMHIYLASGLLHIHKDRHFLTNPGGSMARILMGVGMILFLSGSIGDCVMSYLYDPDLAANNLFTPLQLAWYNLVTTLLWNINAILFLWADCIVYNLPILFRNRVNSYRIIPQTPQDTRSLPLLEATTTNNTISTSRSPAKIEEYIR